MSSLSLRSVAQRHSDPCRFTRRVNEFLQLGTGRLECILLSERIAGTSRSKLNELSFPPDKPAGDGRTALALETTPSLCIRRIHCIWENDVTASIFGRLQRPTLDSLNGGRHRFLRGRISSLGCVFLGSSTGFRRRTCMTYSHPLQVHPGETM